MDKNKATNLLKESGHYKIVEIKMKPGEFVDKHIHDWNVDIIILQGSLQINYDNNVKVLSSGDRFKLKKNIEHTDYSGVDGVFFLSARPS